MNKNNDNQSEQGEYIEFNQETNAIDYLKKVLCFLKSIESKPENWKWVAISLHGALYGFAICSLRGTNNCSVSKDNGNLIKFDEALKRSQEDEYMQMYQNSRTLEITGREKQSILTMKDLLRNNFQHFIPKTWAIEISGMPTVTRDCIRVIEFLALETNNFQHHLSEEQKKKIESIIKNIREILN